LTSKHKEYERERLKRESERERGREMRGRREGDKVKRERNREYIRRESGRGKMVPIKQIQYFLVIIIIKTRYFDIYFKLFILKIKCCFIN
jgi:hypothetical protein